MDERRKTEKTKTVHGFPYFFSYNDDLERCFTAASMGISAITCERTHQVYEQLLSAMRFPYCDLSELDQHVRLHEALALPEHKQRHPGSGAGDTPGAADTGSGSDSVLLSGAVWARVGVLLLLVAGVLVVVKA